LTSEAGQNYFQENAEKENFLCDIFGLHRYVLYRNEVIPTSIDNRKYPGSAVPGQ